MASSWYICAVILKQGNILRHKIIITAKAIGHFIILVILCSCFTRCTGRQYNDPLVIEEQEMLDSIPSGSGIVLKNDTAFIIGDDATSVYALNINDRRQIKIPITGLPVNEYRESRPVKHDFESAALASFKGKELLMAFGSGSAGSRDSLLLLDINNRSGQKIISLERFYAAHSAQSGVASGQWNIEAATISANHLFLFNRGNNMIFSCNVEQFLEYITGTGLVSLVVLHHKVTLPSINGYEARFSGACTLNEDEILFCASVEDTPDWTKDGPVLGSFIGIYSISKKKIVSTYLFKNKNGEPFKEKLESLDILQQKGNAITILAIGDNDDGSTGWWKLALNK